MNLKLANLFKGDKVIWMIFFILCLVSIIEVFSASSFLTFHGGSYLGPLFKHSTFIFVGFLCMLVILNIPCKYFKIATFPLLIFSFIMLIAVFFIGESTNGANRWVGFGGFQFQPSEIAKGALILAVAQILSSMQTENGTDKIAFHWIMGLCVFIIGPIFVENFSTAALISAVVLAMMFIAKVPGRQLGKLLGGVAAAITLVVILTLTLGDAEASQKNAEGKTAQTELVDESAASKANGDEEAQPKKRGKILHRFDTWKSRIMKFTNGKEVAASEYDLDKDAQVAHANIAIVNSNYIGRGPGNSDARDFLSQAFSDFIYAIIIEEMGIFGAAFIAILYVILFWRVGNIARSCANTFPAYLAMGIGLLLVIQAMFNMMVAVGMVPVTGQPLPLISKGGTSTIINCIYIGMLLSISKSAKKKQTIKA